MKKKSLFAGTAGLLLMLTFLPMQGAHAQEQKKPPQTSRQATEPHLFFKKSVVIKKYKDGQVFTEPHTVKRGQHLWQILRRHYKMSNAKIATFTNITKAVNPEIKNIHRLYPNQHILIPFKYTRTAQTTQSMQTVSVQDDEHLVKPDEYLAMILRKKYNMHNEIIFKSRTYELFAQANPDIQNIHRLEKGQKIIIPAEILAFGKPGLKEVAMVKPGAVTADHPSESFEAEGSQAVTQGYPQAPVETPRPQGALSPEETRARELLAVLAHSFDGTDNRTGKAVIPLEEQSSIILDYTKVPLYEFPWGKKILFDYGGKLPPSIKEVIVTEWENAEVVSVQKRDDLESILTKVLDESGFYKVEKGGEYIVNRDNIQVSVSGNWILFKDNLLKNVFVVNLVNNEQETMSPALRSYFASIGLNIVELGLHNKPRVHSQQADSARAVFHKIQAEHVVLTDTILDILGFKYHKNYNTNIFQNTYSGFSLEVLADRMFKRNETTYLIDFNKLPDKICEIIAQQGINLLQIDSQHDDLNTTAKRVLDYCGAPYSPPPAQFHYARGPKAHVKLTIPGFLIKNNSADILLTHIDLKEPIVQFLSDMEVKIVQF